MRATGGNNASRNLIVNTYGSCCGTGNWNSHLTDPLTYMEKPQGETDHIIFEVHSYPNIENLSNAKKEVDGMMTLLKDKLVKKGAPVIIGEWGTSNVDADKNDYVARRDDFLDFADHFVKKAKENNIGTFFWMGLSEGMARLYPAFSQPDLALTILQAYHGENHNPELPTMEDRGGMSCTVNYTSQWAEFNLVPGYINAADYKSLHVELAEEPEAGSLHVKYYSTPEKTVNITGKTSDLSLANLGEMQRVTLQWKKAVNGSVKVKEVYLVKKDGSKEYTDLGVFWGCNMTDIDASAGIDDVIQDNPLHDGTVYDLQGRRVKEPLAPGIYIRNGQKFIIR